MHEMGIALEIIDIAVASIPKDLAAPRIVRVNLKIGRLSAVVADSLRFCFEVAARDTLLEGSALAIEEVPVRARCRACGHEWTIEEPAFLCEACGDGGLDLLSGRELDIESIELAEGDD